jgi:hypothetical protein
MKPWLGMLVGVALIFSGCGPQRSDNIEQVTIQEKLLPRQNATSYEFSASLANVTNAIGKAFGPEHRTKQWSESQNATWKGKGGAVAQKVLTDALRKQGAILLWKADGDALTRGIFTKPGNENDAYLYGGGASVGESKTYFKDDQPLIYYADFHIHLTAIGPRKTRVDIFTYDSSVVTGVDESWSPHGPALICASVDPTTIEQYQILLKVGENLGAKDMPSLVTPGPDASVKELTLPRER